jgi:hypothetical protein
MLSAMREMKDPVALFVVRTECIDWRASAYRETDLRWGRAVAAGRLSTLLKEATTLGSAYVSRNGVLLVTDAAG